MADYDIFGNIAIIKSEKKTRKQKLIQAKELLKKPSIKTVLEKSTDVKGRLRTIKTKYIAGEKNLIARYNENGCAFKFNVETCYFSPRLSNDRKEIALRIKKKNKVLVMFAGAGPYPIVFYKYSKPEKIIAVEIGKECCKYFKENLKLNRIPEGKIEIIQGDVKKKITGNLGNPKKSDKIFGTSKTNKIKKSFEGFDIIMMARPNLKNTFLKQGLSVSKKGTIIFYHLFCRDEDLEKEITKLQKESIKLKRKIKIKNIKQVGEIAPYKHRYRLEIEVLK